MVRRPPTLLHAMFAARLLYLALPSAFLFFSLLTISFVLPLVQPYFLMGFFTLINLLYFTTSVIPRLTTSLRTF